MWQVYTRPTSASDFFQKLWQFSSFFMFITHIRTKKSQDVENNSIQLLTQILYEVGSVCGSGEFFFNDFFFLNPLGAEMTKKSLTDEWTDGRTDGRQH
jgi:hypothetical protein